MGQTDYTVRAMRLTLVQLTLLGLMRSAVLNEAAMELQSGIVCSTISSFLSSLVFPSLTISLFRSSSSLYFPWIISVSSESKQAFCHISAQQGDILNTFSSTYIVCMQWSSLLLQEHCNVFPICVLNTNCLRSVNVKVRGPGCPTRKSVILLATSISSIMCVGMRWRQGCNLDIYNIAQMEPLRKYRVQYLLYRDKLALTQGMLSFREEDCKLVSKHLYTDTYIFYLERDKLKYLLRQKTELQRNPSEKCFIEVEILLSDTIPKDKFPSKYHSIFEQEKRVDKVDQYEGHRLRDLLSYPRELWDSIKFSRGDYIYKGGETVKKKEKEESSEDDDSDSSDDSSQKKRKKKKKQRERKKKSKSKEKKKRSKSKEKKRKSRSRDKDKEKKGKEREKEREKQKQKQKEKGSKKEVKVESIYSKVESQPSPSQPPLQVTVAHPETVVKDIEMEHRAQLQRISREIQSGKGFVREKKVETSEQEIKKKKVPLIQRIKGGD